MDDSRSVIFRIFTKERISYNGFSQIAFRIALPDSFVYRILKNPSFKMDILAYFQEYNGHAGVLANGDPVLTGNLQVLLQLSQNLLSQR